MRHTSQASDASDRESTDRIDASLRTPHLKVIAAYLARHAQRPIAEIRAEIRRLALAIYRKGKRHA